MSRTTTVSRVTDDYVKAGRVHVLQDKPLPPYITIFRIHGPFLFGATDKLTRALEHLDDLQPVVIFRLRNMTTVDATGLKALEDVSLRLRASGRTAIFCGAPDHPRAAMRKAGFDDIVGAENIAPNVDEALVRAAKINEAFGQHQWGNGAMCQ